MSAADGVPYNAVTGADYRGRNVDRLVGAAAAAGYDLARGWAGYRQWVDAGRCVRKGEHGTACMTVVSVTDPKAGPVRKPRGFKVFHYDQTVELGADVDVETEPVPSSAASVPAAVKADDVAVRTIFDGFGWGVTR